VPDSYPVTFLSSGREDFYNPFQNFFAWLERKFTAWIKKIFPIGEKKKICDVATQEKIAHKMPKDIRKRSMLTTC